MPGSARIDSLGVDIYHPEIIDRSYLAYSESNDNGEDYNGHGTFMASLIVGRSIGCAKNAKIGVVKMSSVEHFSLLRSLCKAKAHVKSYEIR